MSSANDALLYKVLLVGESGVGKTSLIRCLTGCPFSHNLLSTVGIDFVKVPFNIDGASVVLQIWDTAGQERFRSITKFQYRGTKGLLLVYDVTNRSTFETLSYWMNTIERELDLDGEEPIPVMIVGNKMDLKENRVVQEIEGKKLAEKHFLSGFVETSAFTAANVRECFESLAGHIVDVYDHEKMDMYRLSSEINTLKRTAVFDEENKQKTLNANKNNKNNKKTKKKKQRKISCKPIRLHSLSKKDSTCQCRL